MSNSDIVSAVQTLVVAFQFKSGSVDWRLVGQELGIDKDCARMRVQRLLKKWPSTDMETVHDKIASSRLTRNCFGPSATSSSPSSSPPIPQNVLASTATASSAMSAVTPTPIVKTRRNSLHFHHPNLSAPQNSSNSSSTASNTPMSSSSASSTSGSPSFLPSTIMPIKSTRAPSISPRTRTLSLGDIRPGVSPTAVAAAYASEGFAAQLLQTAAAAAASGEVGAPHYQHHSMQAHSMAHPVPVYPQPPQPGLFSYPPSSTRDERLIPPSLPPPQPQQAGYSSSPNSEAQYTHLPPHQVGGAHVPLRAPPPPTQLPLLQPLHPIHVRAEPQGMRPQLAVDSKVFSTASSPSSTRSSIDHGVSPTGSLTPTHGSVGPTYPYTSAQQQPRYLASEYGSRHTSIGEGASGAQATPISHAPNATSPNAMAVNGGGIRSVSGGSHSGPAAAKEEDADAEAEKILGARMLEKMKIATILV
ncbi:uncharacterized protein V1516DRAFT_12462 [Lipomyces oligophaga]|uniref:uncharacterized protein n=1 Tax=Lipomyces oligophaga TaxID=45792 RepID=UPI0034CD6F6F